MIRPIVAFGLCGLLITACGTTRTAARRETTPASSNVRAQAPAPALSPERDPANVERRFGTAEARARKQEAKRKQQDQQKQVEVAPPERKTP